MNISWDATADLKPYPAYRDSGVPWLGQVPNHWEVRRGKSLFCCVDVRSSSGEEELLTVSSERGVVPRSSADVTMFKAESYVGYKLCWPGDLVINSLWAWARGLGVTSRHGIVSSAYGVYRLQPNYEKYSGFIHELVRSSPFQWELQVRSKGIWISRLQLTDDSFLGAPFPLPSLPEQAGIVRYLDHVDRQIRRYIWAKQKQIKLLEEQRQAIIHAAVTRGLGPDVRFKPSGVDWLGDVPEHWEIRRLKTIARMKSGESITGLSINETSDYPVFGGNGLRGYTSDYTHEGDYVLIGRQGALCGNVHYAHGRFWASEHAVVASLFPGNDLVWYGELLRILNLNQYSLAAAQPGLAVERIQNLKVPVPPLGDQCAIARLIESETYPIGLAITQAERQNALLREYRTRLIADVVTGKLDVREVAAGLPREVEEPDFLDNTGYKSEMDEGLEPDEPNSESEDDSS